LAGYSGKDGSSIKNAIKILGARDEIEGIRAEYQWLAEKFGEQGKGFTLEMQSLVDDGRRKYDRMDIMLADGTRKTIYFDITDFFGK